MDIENIIKYPDYVGINPSNQSITFVKLYKTANEYIRVAVKVNTSKVYFAKTLHLLSTYPVFRF